jgi:hypothetical protein
MNKDEIIKNLCQQNEDLKQKVSYWKKEFQRMEAAYYQLVQGTVGTPKITPSIEGGRHEDLL